MQFILWKIYNYSKIILINKEPKKKKKKGYHDNLPQSSLFFFSEPQNKGEKINHIGDNMEKKNSDNILSREKAYWAQIK